MRAKLAAGDEGQVILPARELEALGSKPGEELEIFTARGAVALLAPAGAARAWFAGSLGALTVAEVVQTIFTSLKSGTLLVELGAGGKKSIYFRDGQVVFAASSDPADRLGNVLWRAGLLKREDLDRCAGLVGPGRPLGQVLVAQKLLTAGELYAGVTLQVREIALAAFSETEGEFAFVEGPFEERNAVKLPERTRDLLLLGMKRLEEIEQVLGSALPSLAAKPVGKGGGEKLEPGSQRLLELLDGARTAREAVSESGLGTYEGVKALGALVKAGRVVVPEAAPAPEAEVKPGAEEQPAHTPVPRASGPFEIYRRILKRVFEELSAAQPDARARLNSWFDRLSDKQRPAFAGVRVGDDGEIDVAQVLINVQSGGQHRGAAARARALEALETFLAFALFEVKNVMPRADAERLLRDVGRMQVGKL